MSERCNLTREEQSRAWKQFPNGLTGEEEESVRDLMTDYLVYKKRGALADCCCTRCGAFECGGGPFKHDVGTSCPQCGARVVMKAYGYLGRYGKMREKKNVVFFRKGADGALLLSAGLAVQTFRDSESLCLDYDEPIYPVPVVDFYERKRYYLAPNKIGAWKRWAGEESCFGIHWLERETPWEYMKNATEPNPAGSLMAPQPDDGLYHLIGKDILSETDLRYSAIQQYFDFAWTEPPSPVRCAVSYLVSYCVRPQLEMLVKLEHMDVVEELLNGSKNAHLVNWKAKAPHSFFRMSKPDYKAFSQNGGTLEQLRIWHDFKKGFRSFEECMTMTKPVSRNLLESLRRSCELAGCSLRETLRRVPYGNLVVWRDYIGMAVRLGLDLSEETVCYPKNLVERHDTYAALIQAQENEEEAKTYRRRYKALCRRYEYEANGLCIVVPVSSEDIVAEGKVLHHCVGGYAARHMEGKLDILFLRSVDESHVPLATIEMNGNRMVQIHGAYNDRDTTPAKVRFRDFTDEWLCWVIRGSRRDTAGNPIKEKERKTA